MTPPTSTEPMYLISETTIARLNSLFESAKSGYIRGSYGQEIIRDEVIARGPVAQQAPAQIECDRCNGFGNLCNHPKASETEGEACPIDDREKCDDKCHFMIPCDVCQHDAALLAQEREKWERELREHLIKISDGGECPSGWEPTDPNRACENDTCAICIFDKAVESLRSEVGK